MSALCRTCCQEAEHAKMLFHKERSYVLHNILKLTGIWLSEKPGVPSRICLTCLLDLHKAMAFRERCIKANESWSEQKDTQADLEPQLKDDIDQVGIRVQLVPLNSLHKPKMAVLRKISPQRSRNPDETPSDPIERPLNFCSGSKLSFVSLVDPLHCEASIQVKKPLTAVLEKKAQELTRELGEALPKTQGNLVHFFSDPEVPSVKVVEPLGREDIIQLTKQKISVRKISSKRTKSIGNLSNGFSGTEVPSIDIQVKIEPSSTSQEQKEIMSARIPQPSNSKLYKTRFKITDNCIYHWASPVSPSVELDPLRCEDNIQVMNEPLLSDDEPVESVNQEIMKEEPGIQHDVEVKSTNEQIIDVRPSSNNKTKRTIRKKSKEEKYAARKRWAAVQRALAKEQRPYFCDQCGKTFSEQGNFNLHLKRHKGVREFQCKECDRRFFSQHLLSLHVRIKHRGEKPYKCKYCGQRFHNCLRRLDHERNHKECPDHRPYVCPICNKAFKKNRMLKFHGVVHTGEQPYQCEICKTHFNRMSSLRTHFKSKQHRLRVEKQEKTKTLDDGDETLP
ncbi:zinc finger protein 620-like isoform X2 [Drosophila elegans]|uniref:zinc finger protein 620-like isoform X2 n=1 Tax=Drosophila elegans TaxID=30023 RepID=UPI001BC84529|nr:zinc finger protein 620-like isoform X2 [Drosophila elegans]